MNKLILLLWVVVLWACSAKVSTTLQSDLPPLDYREKVVLYTINQTVPENAVLVGSVKIGDSGFSTNCGWNVVMEQAEMEARKAGGNILHLTEHIPPSPFGSSCDRIKADIYKVPQEALAGLANIAASDVDTTWNYAKLFLYRPNMARALTAYNIYLGDSVIWRSKNASRELVLLTKEGPDTLWAKTEARAEIPLVVEHGQEYYVQCTVGMGVMVGRPILTLVPAEQGKVAYNSIKVR